MMSSFKANGLGSINLGNGRFYIGPFKNGKFDTSGMLYFLFQISMQSQSILKSTWLKKIVAREKLWNSYYSN